MLHILFKLLYHAFFYVSCFQYIFLLLLIFLMEAMVGLLSYVYEEQVEADLELNLNNTFLTSYMVDNDKTAAIDFLQEKVSTILHRSKPFTS